MMSKPIARLAAIATVSFGFAVVSPVHAQPLPRSFAASPDVYKVIAQNEQYKVISVTWKPGQKDVLHAHPANAVYYLTDCNLRAHAPDGTFRDFAPKVGAAIVQPPIPAHALENVGTADCRLVMFEPS